MQEISAGGLLGTLRGLEFSALIRLIVGVLCAVLKASTSTAAPTTCDEDTRADAIVFSTIYYKGNAQNGAVRDLALDGTPSCVVTHRSKHGQNVSITWNAQEPYVNTSVDPKDTPVLYWPIHAELLARYNEERRRQHASIGVCAVIGTLKIWSAQIVQLTLVAPPGRDLSRLTFQSDQADYVTDEVENCDADPVGYHSAVDKVKFKIASQQSGCISLLRGTLDAIAWIPTEALARSTTLALSSYLVSNCNSKHASDTFNSRTLGTTTRDDKYASELKGVTLKVEVLRLESTVP